jgi:sulfate/thiosulfate transport system substrate-binding protein
MHIVWSSLRRWLSLVGVGSFLVFAIAACSSQAPNGAEITLVSYAVTKAAYSKIIPLFTAAWEQKTGQNVSVNQSYGGSGSQTRAVIDGLEADVVNLALELDVDKIEKAGLIDKGWQKEFPNDSILTKSVVAFSYRNENPKSINTWEDLVKPGVEIITANPKTSGAARWNFLAVYGAGQEKLKDTAKAQEFTRSFYQNARVLTRDARESTAIFVKQNQGDVMLNYENEFILAAQAGEKIPFVVPTDINISIDAPVAVIDANVKKHGNEALAKAFVDFLFTPPAQQEFAKHGFRPILPEVEAEYKDRFPKVDKLLTAKNFGNWGDIQSQFFADNAVFDRIQASLVVQ